MSHELFLTTIETTKIRNAFANNASTDIKLSKAQISKIIQSGGSFGSWLANVGKKTLTNVVIPLARYLASNAINKFERKISGKELSEQEKDLLSLFRMKMIPGHIPDGHFPDGLFPDGHFPDGHFPDQTHPRRTLPRLDTSPTDISPTRQMPDGHFPD